MSDQALQRAVSSFMEGVICQPHHVGPPNLYVGHCDTELPNKRQNQWAMPNPLDSNRQALVDHRLCERGALPETADHLGGHSNVVVPRIWGSKDSQKLVERGGEPTADDLGGLARAKQLVGRVMHASEADRGALVVMAMRRVASIATERAWAVLHGVHVYPRSVVLVRARAVVEITDTLAAHVGGRPEQQWEGLGIGCVAEGAAVVVGVHREVVVSWNLVTYGSGGA